MGISEFRPRCALASAGLLLAIAAVAASGASTDIIPADRVTVWNPGLNSIGGIPNRTTISTTVNASTYGNGANDATAGIQAAIDACPVGQVVQLSAGTFKINDDIVFVNKGITLRGAGAGLTTLSRTNGAVPGSGSPNAAKPVIIVGPSRWASPGSAVNLAADAAKGATSVKLAATPTGGLAVGQIILIDEASGAAWRTDVLGAGQVWASSDFRVTYQRHNPARGGDDPWPDAAGWFCRQDRPTCEIKEVQSYDAPTKTVTFTSPFHIDYRTSHAAQLYVYANWDQHVKMAGVEDLKVQGGDDGNLRFVLAAYSWAARVEDTIWLGEGFALDHCFRVEVRDSYVHHPTEDVPGGGSYNISLANGTSEALIENNISFHADKVMVSRCSGAGAVVGYNYMDDGLISYAPTWVEIGLNASHMVGCHHVLFEGNYCFNADSDYTHGNSILHTYFRNHLSGQRKSFTDDGPRRCIGLMPYSYWMSFAGNVLGRPGLMSGWVYQSQDFNSAAVWMLGWNTDAPNPDPNITALTYRHGNFDYVTNAQAWDPTVSNHVLPNSLYLTQKPAFFGSHTWPWVQPEGGTKLFILPAKERFDGMGSAPAAPSNLAATAASSTQITLGWTDNASNETGVKIERKTGSGGTWAQIAVAAANATSYQSTGLAASTTYFYRVRATNAAGDSAYSSEASATTTSGATLPVITTQPANKSVTAGQTATFTVVATGSPTPTYQWRKGGATISGAIGASYTTPATVIGDSGKLFSVVVSNSAGGVTSANATLTVTASGGTTTTTGGTATGGAAGGGSTGGIGGGGGGGSSGTDCGFGSGLATVALALSLAGWRSRRRL